MLLIGVIALNGLDVTMSHSEWVASIYKGPFQKDNLMMPFILLSCAGPFNVLAYTFIIYNKPHLSGTLCIICTPNVSFLICSFPNIWHTVALYHRRAFHFSSFMGIYIFCICMIDYLWVKIMHKSGILR